MSALFPTVADGRWILRMAWHSLPSAGILVNELLFCYCRPDGHVPLLAGFPRYNASDGNAEHSQASGAYIFRPDTFKAFPIAHGVHVYQIKVGKAQSHLLQIDLFAQ